MRRNRFHTSAVSFRAIQSAPACQRVSARQRMSEHVAHCPCVRSCVCSRLDIVQLQEDLCRKIVHERREARVEACDEDILRSEMRAMRDES